MAFRQTTETRISCYCCRCCWCCCCCCRTTLRCEKNFIHCLVEFSYALVVSSLFGDNGGGFNATRRTTKFFVQKLVSFERIIFVLCERSSCRTMFEDIHKYTKASKSSTNARGAFKNLSFISFMSEIDNNNFPCLWTHVRHFTNAYSSHLYVAHASRTHSIQCTHNGK